MLWAELTTAATVTTNIITSHESETDQSKQQLRERTMQQWSGLT